MRNLVDQPFIQKQVHKHMLRNKIKSMMYVLNKDTQDKNVKKFFFKKKFKS